MRFGHRILLILLAGFATAGVARAAVSPVATPTAQSPARAAGFPVTDSTPATRRFFGLNRGELGALMQCAGYGTYAMQVYAAREGRSLEEARKLVREAGGPSEQEAEVLFKALEESKPDSERDWTLKIFTGCVAGLHLPLEAGLAAKCYDDTYRLALMVAYSMQGRSRDEVLEQFSPANVPAERREFLRRRAAEEYDDLQGGLGPVWIWNELGRFLACAAPGKPPQSDAAD